MAKRIGVRDLNSWRTKLVYALADILNVDVTEKEYQRRQLKLKEMRRESALHNDRVQELGIVQKGVLASEDDNIKCSLEDYINQREKDAGSLIKYRSEEMEVIASRNQSKWKMAVLTFVSKILNVKQNYPYYWRYKGRKLEQTPSKLHVYLITPPNNREEL